MTIEEDVEKETEAFGNALDAFKALPTVENGSEFLKHFEPGWYLARIVLQNETHRMELDSRKKVFVALLIGLMEIKSFLFNRLKLICLIAYCASKVTNEQARAARRR